MTMSDAQSILAQMIKAVEEGDEVLAASAAEAAVAAGIDPQEAILEGLVPGMVELGRQYEVGECYVPELIVAAEALYAGLAVLQPLVTASTEGKRSSGVVVIGAVQGDVHDIGKNLVKLMLEVSGFEIHDLGRDVPMEQFIEECQTHSADLLCMSSLMTTTMKAIKDFMPQIKATLPDVKVMIGGAPISQRLAEEWGADGYGENAVEAARMAEKLMDIRAWN
jgi:corrinoid protein of di/trimethylamine methyltransferase